MSNVPFEGKVEMKTSRLMYGHISVVTVRMRIRADWFVTHSVRPYYVKQAYGLCLSPKYTNDIIRIQSTENESGAQRSLR